MSKFNKIQLILHFICLLIANIPIVYGRLDSLLSRIYDKTQVNNRPLIVILDNSYVKDRLIRPEHKEINPLLISSDEEHGHTEPVFHKLVQIAKKSTKPKKRPVTGKNRFRARNEITQRSRIQSPIVKSLLRISNELQCEAKDDCAQKCKIKFFGVKKNKCVITCEKTYECQEMTDPCVGDECADNSCQSDSCEETTQGSTKGYAMTSVENNCYKGRC